MEGVRSVVQEGVKFTLVEDFRLLGRVLAAQDQSGRWDVLAVDEYMTAEIACFGNQIHLAMLAELEASQVPPAAQEDPDLEVEFENNKLRIKYHGTYENSGRSALVAVVNRINMFRRLLGKLLVELKGGI
ncbi:MAG: hypothetical protein QXT50_01060 [Thermofilum sp.]